MHLYPRYAVFGNIVCSAVSDPANDFQESTSQTYPSTEDSTTDMVACGLTEEGAPEELSLSANVVGLAAGGQINPTPIVPAAGGAVVSTAEGSNDQVNQAWFTTKEDKDSLHGKGVLAIKDNLKPIHSQEWWTSNFTYSLTRNITSHSQIKTLAFHSLLLAWKIIIL